MEVGIMTGSGFKRRGLLLDALAGITNPERNRGETLSASKGSRLLFLLQTVYLKVMDGNGKPSRVHSYEAKKLELLAGQSEKSVPFSRNSNNSNRERTLECLHLSAPIAEAASNLELISAAKIIKDFQNSKISMRGNSSPGKLVEDEPSGLGLEETDYGRKLTKIEKGRLIDSLSRTSPARISQKVSTESVSKDMRLFSLLQTDYTKVVNGNGKLSRVYSYDATEIKLSAGTLGNSANGLSPDTDNSIYVANLLHAVETSNDPSVFLLDIDSKVVDGKAAQRLVDLLGHEVHKRINGISMVCTIEKGDDKMFVVTSWKMKKSDALDVLTAPGLYVRNDSDCAKVKKRIEKIEGMAGEISKVAGLIGKCD